MNKKKVFYKLVTLQRYGILIGKGKYSYESDNERKKLDKGELFM